MTCRPRRSSLATAGCGPSSDEPARIADQAEVGDNSRVVTPFRLVGYRRGHPVQPAAWTPSGLR
jgi:hypothetical protein